jgi:hypothetical protein
MSTRKATTALTCGAVAGPLFTVAGLAQAATRAGFDPARHQLSLLSNGSLGWVQMLNFIVTGGLFLLGAMGMRATLTSGHGRTWGPRLIGAFGAGMIGAGIFRPDPAFGFPPGTPDAKPDPVSWHGVLHYSIASAALLALIIAAVVFARRFAAARNRGWALGSAAAGAALLAGVAAASSGSASPAGSVWLIASALTAFLWASAVAAHLHNASRRSITGQAPRRTAGDLTTAAGPAGPR